MERYIIPDEEKQKVQDTLYPSTLDEECLDILTNSIFNVSDYIVTLEGDGDSLVTPYYARVGGILMER